MRKPTKQLKEKREQIRLKWRKKNPVHCIICKKKIDFTNHPRRRTEICLTQDGSLSDCAKIKKEKDDETRRKRVRANKRLVRTNLERSALKTTKRKCLGIQHGSKPFYFDSYSVGHRLCPPCQRRNEGMGNRAYTLIFKG